MKSALVWVWRKHKEMWDTWTPVFRLLVLLIILVSLTMIGVASLVVQFGTVTNDTNRIVRNIDEQTNPEAVKAQQQVVDGIIFRVNCGTREAFEDAVNEFVKQNPAVLKGTIVITDNCPRSDQEPQQDEEEKP